MKFAKVLFFVCVIGICAAAALERATSKAEAEYTAATNALKLEEGEGYKEMFQNTYGPPSRASRRAQATQNQKVSIEVGTSKVEALYDAKLLENGSFLSGIPFFFASASSAPVVTNNLVKLNANTYYVPFNTISNSCYMESSADPSEKIHLICYLNNKSGASVLKIYFLELAKDRTNQANVSAIANKLQTKQASRKTFISGRYEEVNYSIQDVMWWQKEIKTINDSDAAKKAEKEKRVADLKAQIAKLTAELALLQKSKVTLSGQLQTVQTTKTETFAKRQTLITYKLSLEMTIKTLQTSISTAEQLKALQASIDKALKELDYWLQGSIYHRVINAAEKTTLLAKKNDNKGFQTMVNDFFFPQ